MTESGTLIQRERILAQLEVHLRAALAGQGRICFLTGEAGSGKTVLLQQFAAQMQEQHPELIIAGGVCDAHTGIGDPYLPFREVLGLLTGDVAGKAKLGTVTVENTNRVKKVFQLAGQVLVKHGPDLIGTIVPGTKLVADMGVTLATKAGWLKTLDKSDDPAASLPGGKGIDQAQIYEQYVNVLRALAEIVPLLITLDDLQWSDSASIGLLFRLARRLEGSRILVIGAFRPDEITLGRGYDRHPLEKVLSEMKRYLGDILIDLEDHNRETGIEFIDAYLDAESNELGRDFRQALCNHTEGNPLFIIELLNDMRERGDLIQNAHGAWITGPRLNWSDLPPRVDAVIEERLERIDGELRHSLVVGSVEGEDFTAEVTATVLNQDVRNLVRQFSDVLQRRHRLVEAQGVERVQRQRLSRYRFRHSLIQQFLYNSLDEVERSYMHEDVGRVLEELFGSQADEIAVQLAFHFERAEIADKALQYLRRAGERASAQHANDEALVHYNRAMTYTDDGDDETRYALVLSREHLYDLLGQREAQQRDLELLEQLAARLDDAEPAGRRSVVALRRSSYAHDVGDYPQAVTAAEHSLAALTGEESNALGLTAAAHLAWGRALQAQGDYESAEYQLQRALSVAHDNQLDPILATAYTNLGANFFYQDNYQEARRNWQLAADQSNRLGDLRLEGRAINNLGVSYYYERLYAKAGSFFEKSFNLHRKMGDRKGEGMALNNLGLQLLQLAEYDRAQEAFAESLEIQRSIDDLYGVANSLNNMARAAADLGHYPDADRHYRDSLRVRRSIGDRNGMGETLTGLGYVQAGLAQLDAAVESMREAVAVRRELGQDNLAYESQAGLAQMVLARQAADSAEALANLEPVLAHIAANGLERVEEPLRVLFACHFVLRAAGDDRADALIAQAHNAMLRQAEQIADPLRRRFFLENVVVCRAIAAAYETANTRATPIA